MFHKIVVAHAILFCIRIKFSHNIKLMIAGKYHSFFFDLFAAYFLFFYLYVDEARQYVKETVTL